MAQRLDVKDYEETSSAKAEENFKKISKSLGKRSHRKQKKSAIRHLISDEDENVRGGETNHAAVYSPYNHHRSHHGYNHSFMFDQSNNYNAAKSTFPDPYPEIQHPDMSTTDESVDGDDTWNNTAVYSPNVRHPSHHGYNPYMFDQSNNYTASMRPPAVPPCSEVVQNPSLNSMLTAWYMAGYYTGLHQNESVGGDETRNRTGVYSPHNRSHHGYGPYMFDQSNNYTAAMRPPAVPPCPEVVKNPALNAMLTAWYMAGYYTGLHQAQKSASHQHSHFHHS